jgi:hypothetical protein
VSFFFIYVISSINTEVPWFRGIRWKCGMGSNFGGYNKGISCVILNFAKKALTEGILCTRGALLWWRMQWSSQRLGSSLISVSYTVNYLYLECTFHHLALKDKGVLDYYLLLRYLHLFGLDDSGVSSKNVCFCHWSILHECYSLHG